MNRDTININVIINDFNDVCNKFNNMILSEDLSKYIYDECKGKSLKSNVKINIKSLSKLNNNQKNKIVDMIRSNYGIDIKENMLYIKQTNIKGIILFIIGILLIIIYNILSNFNLASLSEIVLIISWVMIWEAVYNYIFLETQKIIENKRLKKLTNCKIKFIEDDINESN